MKQQICLISIAIFFASTSKQLSLEERDFSEANFMGNFYRIVVNIKSEAYDKASDEEKAESLKNLSGDLQISPPNNVDLPNTAFQTFVSLESYSSGDFWYSAVIGKRLIYTWMPETSWEPFETKLANKNVKIPGSWSIEEYDFRAYSYQIFSLVKNLLFLLQMYVIFVRPATAKTHKVPLFWLVGSIVSLQLMFYIPYITGNFGGVIDEMNVGLMRAYKRTFDNNLSGYRLSEKYLVRQYSSYMNKWSPIYDPEEYSDLDDFLQGEEFKGLILTRGESAKEAILAEYGYANLAYLGFVTNPILENVHELYIVLFAMILPIFSNLLKNDNLLRVTKLMKSGAVASFALPIITSCLTNFVHFYLVFSFDAFSVISLLMSIAILWLMCWQIHDMFTPSHPTNKYRNNEESILDLDCHSSSPVPFFFRRMEFVVAMIIPFVIYITQNAGIASSIIVLFLLAIYLVGIAVKIGSQRNRTNLSTINRLKLFDSILKIIRVLIFLIFWGVYEISGGIPLIGIKILTIIYGLTLMLELCVIISEILYRFYIESLKIFWVEKYGEYHMNQTHQISPEDALDSIGLSKNQRRTVGGENHGIDILLILVQKADSKPNIHKEVVHLDRVAKSTPSGKSQPNIGEVNSEKIVKDSVNETPQLNIGKPNSEKIQGELLNAKSKDTSQYDNQNMIAIDNLKDKHNEISDNNKE